MLEKVEITIYGNGPAKALHIPDFINSLIDAYVGLIVFEAVATKYRYLMLRRYKNKKLLNQYDEIEILEKN